MTRSVRIVCVAVVLWLITSAAGVLAGVTVAAISAQESGGDCTVDGGPGGGAQSIQDRQLSSEQMDNAHTVVSVALDRGLAEQAAIIAVAAALTESDLRNLDYGDRDSLGILQQRPSQGWGTPEQIRQPAYAAGAFYDALVAIPDWQSLPPGQAAQEVQRSAYPDRYAEDVPTARGLVAKFWTTTPVRQPARTDGQPGRAGSPSARQVVAPTGCRDQGGSDIPLGPGNIPRGFVLPDNPQQARAVAFAVGQIGKPYVWGAKGPDAFDCSGLTAAAWAQAGVTLSAGTINQVHDGTAVSSLDSVQPGDLLFTPGSLGTVDTPRHVGIYVGRGLLVNAYDEKTGVVVESLQAWDNDIVAIRRPGGTR